MLSQRRCPHTGVVNFYLADEPYLPVGSAVKAERSGYLWRCYAEPFVSTGTVDDVGTAALRVAELCKAAGRSEAKRYDEAA